MTISFHWSAITRTKWYEYAVRFVFGGAISVVAGLLAKRFGPALGGLFLAFPAIFPSSATLVEKHERDKKSRAGIADNIRGRKAAALDAAGASMGCVGLACFALIVWSWLPNHNAALVLVAASVGWLGTSILIWRILKSRHGRDSH
jgi:Protein of unknown function (DUF3147)